MRTESGPRSRPEARADRVSCNTCRSTSARSPRWANDRIRRTTRGSTSPAARTPWEMAQSASSCSQRAVQRSASTAAASTIMLTMSLRICSAQFHWNSKLPSGVPRTNASASASSESLARLTPPASSDWNLSQSLETEAASRMCPE